MQGLPARVAAVAAADDAPLRLPAELPAARAAAAAAAVAPHGDDDDESVARGAVGVPFSCDEGGAFVRSEEGASVGGEAAADAQAAP